MTAPDHAAIVRDALNRFANPITDEALAALDALVAGHAMKERALTDYFDDASRRAEAAEAERDEALRDADAIHETATIRAATLQRAHELDREAGEARVAELEKALERIREKQPETLRMIEANGFVFDSIGNEPGNWQHLAFTIYAELCEVDTIARAALTTDAEAAGEGEGRRDT